MKYGRLPARTLHGIGFLGDYVKGRLPAPPPQAHYGSLVGAANFPVDGNDRYGCCTIAAAAHCIQLWNAEVQEDDFVPSEQQVIDTYLSLTGGQDSGLVEADVLRTWQQDGLWGERIAGYAPVPTGSIRALQQAVAFYGTCYLGVVVTDVDEQRFADHEVWQPEPRATPMGGHAVPVCGYDGSRVYIVTWGAIQAVTYPWLEAQLEEAWCVLPHEYEEAGHGPREIAWDDLRADLSRV